MRRTAEWLLLPLFLLPIVVGIGLHLWAQHDYERRLDRVRADGAGTLARILAREENEDPRRRMWSHSAALTRQVTNPRWATTKVVTRLEWEGQTAYLFGAWSQEVARPTPTWVGAASYPAGLTAGGLSDAGVRLAVQTGETKAFTENEDDVAAAFRTLLEEPRLLLLSHTPLPAQTKLWLVRRWK